MNNNRMYAWILVCAIAGGLVALVIPGLDVAMGIGLGTAAGIAIGSDHGAARCWPLRRRRHDQSAP